MTYQTVQTDQYDSRVGLRGCRACGISGGQGPCNGMKIYGKHTSQLKLVVGAPKAHPYKSHVVSNPHITIIINVFHKLSYKLYTW